MITLMLIPLRNCHNLEVDRVRVMCIHIHTFTLVKAVGCSAAIGNAKRVGHRCVRQPEELRSEDHIT